MSLATNIQATLTLEDAPAVQIRQRGRSPGPAGFTEKYTGVLLETSSVRTGNCVCHNSCIMQKISGSDHSVLRYPAYHEHIMKPCTIHPSVHSADYTGYDTKTLRDRFLIETLFEPGQTHWHYCAENQLLLCGICPDTTVSLQVPDALGPEPILERREMGVVNLGEPGEITVDGERYAMDSNDGLYIGMGAGEVTLSGAGAKFYCTFAPAHRTCPIRHIRFEEAEPLRLGSADACNERTIYFYIAPGVTESCQLMMGITVLETGSVWNTMPCHRHLRRMEVYLYCRLPEDQMIVHLMGRPEETRNLILRNEQAVISPSWSIHCAAGTQNYAFLWCMVGENQDFKDMDLVDMADLY